MKFHLSLLVLFSSSFLMSAAEPRISDRAPRAGEWGCRPADGASVRLNPPSLTWIHEGEAASYTVQWARKRDFATRSRSRTIRGRSIRATRRWRRVITRGATAFDGAVVAR